MQKNGKAYGAPYAFPLCIPLFFRAVEKERHRAGADVRAGDRLVVDLEAFAGKAPFAQKTEQIVRPLAVVRVGDADARGLIQRALVEIVRQLGVGLLIPCLLYTSPSPRDA